MSIITISEGSLYFLTEKENSYLKVDLTKEDKESIIYSLKSCYPLLPYFRPGKE
jgi:hypothetical protein